MTDAMHEEDNVRIYHATRKTLISTRLIRREKRGEKRAGNKTSTNYLSGGFGLTKLISVLTAILTNQVKKMPETWVDERNVTTSKDYCS